MLYDKTKLFIDNYINLSEYTGNIEKEGGDLIVKERMIPFCTIHSFKGLENDIIIIPSITQISPDRTKLLLYIGLTRTKVRTIIYCHQSIKSLVK
jgi:ATP-dependent exoDNAse (exonuclease V) beta subunit